jgi:signal transduction histidine kinase
MPTFFRRDSGSATQKPAGTARVGHVYLDTRRRLLYCLNETARQLIREGVPIGRDDLERQPLQTLAGAAVTAADLPLLRAWRDRTPQEATFVLARPGAVVQHLTWSAAPLADAGGELLGVLATVTVAAPEPDWQELAGLAHDLRGPLQVLRLLVPLLASMPLPTPEARELFERMRAASDRALSVGLDLLEWCRGPTQAGRRAERKWFALGPFLAALVDEQLGVAQRKGIGLRTDLAEAQPLEVQTDAVRLGRLLANLLSNAVRYTAAGQVRFTAGWRRDGAGQKQALALAVADTGTGLSAEDQESIFQPFERGKAGREGDSSGSGLGLAVVDRLVKDLGLTLEVFSEYGQGSTFELLLPLSILRPTAVKPSATVEER